MPVDLEWLVPELPAAGDPDPPAGGLIAWGARENGDPSDPDSPLVPIPPGSLHAVQSCTDRIWKQYSRTNTWPDTFEIIGELFRAFDATLGQVSENRYRSTAEGVQLDEVGALVGRARGSLVDDDDYRLAILVDAATLFASGTIPEVLELAAALTSQAPRLREYRPATYVLTVPELDGSTFLLLLDVMGDVPSAGVAALLETYDSAAVAGWSSAHGSDADDGAGSWSSAHGSDADDVLALWSTAREIGA